MFRKSFERFVIFMLISPDKRAKRRNEINTLNTTFKIKTQLKTWCIENNMIEIEKDVFQFNGAYTLRGSQYQKPSYKITRFNDGFSLKMTDYVSHGSGKAKRVSEEFFLINAIK